MGESESSKGEPKGHQKQPPRKVGILSLDQASDQRLDHRGENSVQSIGMAFKHKDRSREDMLKEKQKLRDLTLHSAHNFTVWGKGS